MFARILFISGAKVRETKFRTNPRGSGAILVVPRHSQPLSEFCRKVYEIEIVNCSLPYNVGAGDHGITVFDRITVFDCVMLISVLHGVLQAGSAHV